MRVSGLVLIVIGLLMLVFNGFYAGTDKKVIDTGALEVRQKERKYVSWPAYAGGFAMAAGIVLLMTSGRRK